MAAIEAPAKPPAAAPGTAEELLVCNCGHTFPRSRMDVKIWIDEDWSTTVFKWRDEGVVLDDIKEMKIGDVIGHALNYQFECPTCDCCHEDDDEIRPDRDDEDDEAGTWMCDQCLEVHDTEEEAYDCCEG